MALSGNAGAISSFFAGKGLSKAGVAAILGTWQAESGLNPGITNSIGAHGLAQWLGSRRNALQATASRMGTNENNINAQLEFAWQELQSPQYAGLLHTLQTTNDPQSAARDFVNVFERPGPGGDPGAPGFAQTFFNGGVPGGSGGGGGSTQNVGNPGPGTGFPNSPLQWLEDLSPEGPLFQLPGGQKLDNSLQGSLSAIGSTLSTLVNFFLDLLRPSFWLRVGAFFMAVILLITGGFSLKGAI